MPMSMLIMLRGCFGDSWLGGLVVSGLKWPLGRCERSWVVRRVLVPLELMPVATARALSWESLHLWSHESEDAIHGVE